MNKPKPSYLTHFKSVDSVLYSVVDLNNFLLELKPQNPEEYFESLTDEIISQQLSGRVANIIYARFKALFPNEIITAEFLISIPHEHLRSTGMSNAKAKFVKDLAQKVVSKELILEHLGELKNEDVIAQLTRVHGIGRWTAEMFLMFSLGREDIFSHGDLGLKNAIKKLYKLENPSKADIEALSIKWSPYRTYACMILWKSLEIKPPSS